jgi:8-oxo-dGTP pyrophosphatase MutT (NUDIX family)
MIIRRKNGALLTFTKSFYPGGLYRLFSGGVEPNERVYDALMRELYEETGLEVDVQRFLAIVTYHADDHTAGTEGPVRFISYVFLVQEVDGVLGVNDEKECLSGYKDITIADLPAITKQLATLPENVAHELGGVLWRDWGRYRAVVSQVVYELLTLN